MGKAKQRKLEKWEIVVGGFSADPFKTRRLKVEGKRLLDFGIVKNNIGRGFLVYHIPTGKQIKEGMVFASVDKARACIMALYHLGTWDSDQALHYRDRAPKAQAVMQEYGA